MGKLSLGSDSNFRLYKKVISGAIWLLPLICPRKLKDFAKTQGAVDTPDQGTQQRSDTWTRAGRCGQQWRPQRPKPTDPLWRVPKAAKSSASVCVMYVCVHFPAYIILEFNEWRSSSSQNVEDFQTCLPEKQFMCMITYCTGNCKITFHFSL